MGERERSLDKHRRKKAVCHAGTGRGGSEVDGKVKSPQATATHRDEPYSKKDTTRGGNKQDEIRRSLFWEGGGTEALEQRIQHAPGARKAKGEDKTGRGVA